MKYSELNDNKEKKQVKIYKYEKLDNEILSTLNRPTENTAFRYIANITNFELSKDEKLVYEMELRYIYQGMSPEVCPYKIAECLERTVDIIKQILNTISRKLELEFHYKYL